MTQDLYQKAIAFAAEKHKDQKIPGSPCNYAVHISNVAMEVFMAYQNKADFCLNTALQLALLHDVLEDTPTTYTELENHFGAIIAEGVFALTKDKNLGSKSLQMQDSLTKITATIKEVAIVKLADRITNLQAPPKHWDNAKIKGYYQEALVIKDTLKDKNAYLENRLQLQIEAYKKYFL